MGLPVLHCPAEVMHIDFYFRAVYHRNWHAILHQAAEFHPNETTYCGNMTSYRFFKTLDAVAQYYFRFRI